MGFSISNKFQVFVLFLSIFQMGWILSQSHAASPANSKISSATEFIKTSCSSTNYPRLCFSSLSIHANSIQTSPRLMAAAALSVSLSSVKAANSQFLKLSQSHGVPLRDIYALKDCLEELSDCMDSLTNSISEMGKLRGPDFDLTINNIQTWVSAALTDETTCSDGFEGKAIAGGIKMTVRNRIVNIAQLTSNALSLINRVADLHH